MQVDGTTCNDGEEMSARGSRRGGAEGSRACLPVSSPMLFRAQSGV